MITKLVLLYVFVCCSFFPLCVIGFMFGDIGFTDHHESKNY